ncbi:hypothetical protein LINPERPRIM_LOCUS15990 [Linum perenne]
MPPHFLPPLPPHRPAAAPKEFGNCLKPDDKDGHYVFAIGDSLTPR